jgi:phosphatidylglycerol:prolipoprotein diacylglycerol transferase
MRPIPTAFHIGPLEIHTYGIGLAITFWFAYRYFEKRLADRGYETAWVSTMFLWVIAAAIVGARAMHVLSDLGYYSHHVGQIVAIWQGGLSSFGGLILAVPVAIIVARKKCPELKVLVALDIVMPVLLAAWAMGRLLGPQLMVAGGGHPTSQWFGMYYDGQVGRRIPVPLIQALEDFTVYLILIFTERRLDRGQDGTSRVGHPAGIVTAIGMILWGIERSLDERLWLGEDGHLGSLLVQIAGVALVVGGGILLIVSIRRYRAWCADHLDLTSGVDHVEGDGDGQLPVPAAPGASSVPVGALEPEDGTPG